MRDTRQPWGPPIVTGKPKSHGNRILYTKYAMGFEAKSRLTIPPQLPLEWDAFHKSYLEALAPSETVAA